MEPLLKALKHKFSKALEESIAKCNYSSDPQSVYASIDLSKAFGDLSSSIALKISKELNADSIKISQKILSNLSNPELVESVTTENGFINFHLNKERVSELIIRAVLENSSQYLRLDIGNSERVLVESPSINPVHPLHMGQLRNALLGNALSNIFEACGYAVEREDYIDDMGRNASIALWGYTHLDDLRITQNPNEKFDHFLGNVYVAANDYANAHDIESEIKATLANMEISGSYEAKLERELFEKIVEAEYQTLHSLDICNDLLIWEGNIISEKLVEKALVILEKKGLANKPSSGKYAGCVVIDLGKIKNPPKELEGLKEQFKVLIRSDGTADYLAKDIAFHMWKYGIIENTFKSKTFIDKQPNGKPLYTTTNEGKALRFEKASKTINIIDTRQSHLQALDKIALEAIAGADVSKGFKHLAYGVVELEGSVQIAGRKGTWRGFTADDLIKEAKEKARQLISSRFKLSDSERVDIASAVALAAIRFEFLKLSNEKKLVFSWSNALNFEGDSGPYCQYTCARASRIIENSGIKGIDASKVNFSALSSDYEFNLVKKFLVAQEMLERACLEYKPNLLIECMSELASLFSKFYEHQDVLHSNPSEREARLALVFAFKQVMSSLLGVCGIRVIERM